MTLQEKANEFSNEQTAAFMAGVEHAKNNMDIDVVYTALIMAGCDTSRESVDKMIDVIELAIDKYKQISIEDIENLKIEWEE